MHKINYYSISTLLGGILTYLFGAIDIAFQVLVIMMLIDYITGIMCGFVSKNLNSFTCINGIFKKIGILVVVIVAVGIDKILNENVLRLAVIFCLIGSEGISVLENCALLGVLIPKKIIEAL